MRTWSCFQGQSPASGIRVTQLLPSTLSLLRWRSREAPPATPQEQEESATALQPSPSHSPAWNTSLSQTCSEMLLLILVSLILLATQEADRQAKKLLWGGDF